jgi:hypothetical protein
MLSTYDADALTEFQGLTEFGRRSFDEPSVFVVIFGQATQTTLLREITENLMKAKRVRHKLSLMRMGGDTPE